MKSEEAIQLFRRELSKSGENKNSGDAQNTSQEATEGGTGNVPTKKEYS